MKWAILGGGNCYALNLARLLLKNGHEVIGIGRSALKGPAFELGARKEGYDYHVYSVGPDTEFIVKLLQGEKPSVIVNFSAQGEGQASFESAHWKYFYRTNTQALVELTEKLHGEKWLHRFIQVGTSELYGSVTDPATEDAPLRPSSPYAISKAAFDLHLVSIAKTAAFPAVIVRPSNAYCPGQQLHRVIPRAFIFGKTGRRLPLHGGGRAEKSYIHADDSIPGDCSSFRRRKSRRGL
jgi:dTDP-glucose 4,6-dehydratase